MHIIESELVNLEYQFFNATYAVNELIMNHFETILPYLAIVSVIIGFLSCFLPCILCNTIKKILLLPCRCIGYIMYTPCPKSKSKSKSIKLHNKEIDEKEQKLIAT
jgi:hypothetical protein